MTHDFHYYVTFMCARNAGFDIMMSKKIALCADGVDGGDMKFVNTSEGKYKMVAFHHGPKLVSYYPLTVYHVTSSVNDTHSMGASIMSVPWMAFHFFPSLEVNPQKNPFYIKAIDRAIGKPKKGEGDDACFSPFELNQSRHLESGLICSKDSRFAKELIKDTASLAKKYGRGKLNYIQAGMLGVRAHIIADLFAHEGFAGCRSMAANALNHANTLNESELKYDLKKSMAASYVKTTGTSRLGHGQAGQRPDEPYVKYRIQRKLDNRNFVKDNRDLYGAAVMTLTEVFKGNSPNVPKDYENWRVVGRDYTYKWEDIQDHMNQERPKRIKALRDFFSKATDLREHNGTDYWAFGHMDSDLQMGFSIAADRHLQWFHEKFFELAGVGIDQYMDVSVLWPWSHDDDAKAREHNKNLLNRKKIHVGKTSGDINGYQIGTHYMKRYDGADLKPSTIYSKFTGIRVTG